MSQKTRGLSQGFMEDLKPMGPLAEIVQMVKQDMTLDFHIRAEEIHIYYRGGRALAVKVVNGGYAASFDAEYCKRHRYEDKLKALPAILACEADVSAWAEALPFIKQTIDEHKGEKEKLEREYQQHVVRENNNAGLKVANGTDYFIVDIEYADVGRCDMIAFKWRTISSHRRAPDGKVRLALIEMKFGDDSLNGSSGLIEHVKKADVLLGDQEKKDALAKEMMAVFRQKRELGLIRSLQGKNEGKTHNNNDVKALSSEKPEFILLLAAHNPNSDKLLKVLAKLETEGHVPMQNAELKIAVANFMGYALYDGNIFDLKTFRKFQENFF